MNIEKKKRFFAGRVPGIYLKFFAVLCVVYIFIIWANRPDEYGRRRHKTLSSTGIFPHLQHPQEFTGDERRIARHFILDTLPGLMQRGLIRKYERCESRTFLHVAGKVWKNRSRFFKESLLSEILVYNKVRGYALETSIVDHRSRRLYAQALSTEERKFFD
jgi:hypothetical protein